MTSYSHGLVALAAVECERQQVGPMRVVNLLDAWRHAEHASRTLRRFPTVRNVLVLGGIVEPESYGRFRTTPVVFRDGGSAANADSVPAATQRLVDALDDTVDPAEWVRAFLAIHPFTDGNGRTAWVLMHWVGNWFDQPRALPHFDFAHQNS